MKTRTLAEKRNRRSDSIRQMFFFLFLVLLFPGSSFAQQSLRQPEHPDDSYTSPRWEGRQRTPAYSSSSAGFFFTQVNIDSNGMNVVGDAGNEPSIAVDPTDPNRIVIGWRQFDTISNNFRQAGNGYTTDGGVTWHYHDVIERGIFRSDPVLDSDSQGVIYYNSLTSDGFNFECQVFKSYDGGVTWDSGVYAYGGDKQWMTIDKTGGIGDGNVYANWSSFYSSCSGQFTRSANYGGSFEPCLTIPGDPYYCTLAVDADGVLYIGGVGGSGFQVIKSETARDSAQAVIFQSPVSVNLDGNISGGGPNPGGLLGQTWVAVDRSAGPTHGNVYLLASVERFSNSDPLDVMFSRSTDGGATWSGPVRVNDDPGQAAYQWFGTMSVAPNGRIDAIWLDTRDNPGTYLSSLYYSSSVDGGVTWSPNERLSDAFDPHIGWPQQNKMGDYFDMVSDEAGAFLAWAGTFNGEQDVYFGRILAEAFIPAAPLLASPPDGSTGQPLSVSLVWNASIGATGYRVQVDTSAGFTAPIVDDSSLTSTSRQADNLDTATVYYWRVNARSSGGTGDWSETWSFTTSVNPPAAPLLVSPVDGATGIPTTVTLVWSDTASDVSYRLQVATDGSFSQPVVDESGLTATSQEVGNLGGETTHYWRVNASGAGGTSLWSDVWTFTTAMAPPGTPVLSAPPDGFVASSTTVLFRWNTDPAAATYRFQLATDESFNNIVVEDTALTTSTRVVSNLMDGLTYYWRVSAANDGGVSPWSEVWSVSVVVTGVEEQGDQLPTEYVLDQNYPNPFNPSTVIRFGVPERAYVVLEVFDILGKRVEVLANREYAAGYYQVSFDGSRLGGGVYFYRLQAGTFVETRKLLMVK